MNHEAEFENAKNVVFSCGINDLARYGKTANSLADSFCPRLIDCCQKYKNTNFVFSSLTLTRDKWLNDEINRFNWIMVDLARDIPNLSFFNSHGLIKLINPDIVWERDDRHGNICVKISGKL